MNPEGKTGIINWYKQNKSRFFTVQDPRDVHSTLFYARMDEGKKLTLVLGKGLNGGLVMTFSW